MNVDQIISWMTLFTDKIAENKDYLSELDTPIGDGDHGANMYKGTQAVKAVLAEKQPESVTDAFKLIGMTLVSKVGGASGPLYGSAFMGMSQADPQAPLAEILKQGLMMIQKRGKATVGEKTMIDVWDPVIKALENQTLSAEKITTFASDTKALMATKGRASYLKERSIGHIDPGAMSSAYLFITMLEAGIYHG